ncbi:glycosyltransferase family 2 protein [Tritonibacter mobilis]|uniref:glycosyltransferase family 2 protein n=1 Tax=Tritonibacter mobilis TaxID=379347 RepID=UPI001D0D3C0F|nr:glycosyltransferase family 2 protein [Tritonibacter mobilis]
MAHRRIEETQPDPGVSVIMPAYNAEMTLVHAVASVQAQSFTDWELILIEDGSSDQTANACTMLAQEDARIRVVYQTENTGAAVARNAGLALARGRYVAFLDADDLWHKEKLERQISFMKEHGAVFSYTGFLRQRGHKQRRVHVPAQMTRERLLQGNVIGCLTAIYDRAHFGDVQMPNLRLRQDFAFWLLLLTRCQNAFGLDEPLAVYRVHSTSLSAGRIKAMRATWKMYRIHLGLSALRSTWYVFSHLVRRILRG